MRKRLILFELILILGLTIAFSGTALAETSENIVHDAEYYILEAQHGKKWAVDDKNIDEKLAEFRKKNGGKSPNILYVLVDDLSFGEMGIPEFNYVSRNSRLSFL
jgi:arylsulfatase